jgi:hypothetical protein
MKKWILLLIVLYSCNTGYCQEIYIGRIPKFAIPEHKSGDFSISATAGLLFNTPNIVQPAGGLKLSVFVGKHISFDSDIMFGRDYVHAGPGIIGIPALMIIAGSDGPYEFESFQGLIALIVIGVMSLEHVAGHIPVNKTFEITPYISLLRYRWAYEYGVYDETNRINEQFTGTLGLELNKYYKRLLLSPYIETVLGYQDGRVQLNAGISCGIFFLR